MIDHLWHLTETGYYHRQGGPYPPFTWEIGSIARSKHQKAAYAVCIFSTADAYPPQYSEKLYMGNIHGGCINVDALKRDGSTYKAQPHSDFLTANDAWFMPVSQKTGPDGCLYILDWYDRYHCYQDAGRDPAGIDRLKGRLYRIAYSGNEHTANFDLSKLSDHDLVGQLEIANNDFIRSTSTRLLAERHHPATRLKLQRFILRPLETETRVAALSALAGSLLADGARTDDAFLAELMRDPEPAMRAWAVRLAGNNDVEAAFAPKADQAARRVSPATRRLVLAAAHDISPDVRLQAAIAAPKVAAVEAIPTLIEILSYSADDPLIPHIVWNNLQPWMDDRAELIVGQIWARGFEKNPIPAEFASRLFDRLLAARTINREALRRCLTWPSAQSGLPWRSAYLRLLSEHLQSRELSGARLEVVKSVLDRDLHQVLDGPRDGTLYLDVTLLTANWGDPAGVAAARELAANPKTPDRRRIAAIEALAAAKDETILNTVESLLSARKTSPPGFRLRLFGALARLDAPKVADLVLAHYAQLDPDEKPLALQLLTQRVRLEQTAAGGHRRRTAAGSRSQSLAGPQAARLRRQTAHRRGPRALGPDPRRPRPTAGAGDRPHAGADPGETRQRGGRRKSLSASLRNVTRSTERATTSGRKSLITAAARLTSCCPTCSIRTS